MKYTILLIVILAANCANKKDGETKCTRLTVTNSTGGAADIRVRSSDSSKTETFSGTPDGTTATARDISFPSLSGALVDCTSGSCQSGTVDLSDGMINTVTLHTNGGAVPSVATTACSTGGGGSSGW